MIKPTLWRPVPCRLRIPRCAILLMLLLPVLLLSTGNAQVSGPPLRIFGYFQNAFQYQSVKSFEKNTLPNTQNGIARDISYTSFTMQQLNLMLQKKISKRWSVFVNFEMVNTYSSFFNWGAFNLEEAWAKYRNNSLFSIKLGLQIPTFNHLNEIKNRTPLLPYIVRPLVYEASFNEFIALEEYLPRRAFMQVDGFLPIGNAKLDYAVFLGNSDDVNGDREAGQTGVDTTMSLMRGGRVGVRLGELKLGVSTTYERVNFFAGLAEILNEPRSKFSGLPRWRIGFDGMFRYKSILAQAEYIDVLYDEGTELIEADKRFVYGTLGWYPRESLFVYGSYWQTDEYDNVAAPGIDNIEKFIITVGVYTAGVAYNISEQLTLKAQYAIADIGDDSALFELRQDINVYALAFSVMF